MVAMPYHYHHDYYYSYYFNNYYYDYYHIFQAAVGGAVSAAYGEAPRDAAPGEDGREVAGLPSLVEVMELVSGQVTALKVEHCLKT